jgi:drug/metabolite transporter (DMT)-like permease
MKWTLVAVIVAATTVGDVLKAKGMKEHGEIHEFGLGAFGRMLTVLLRNKLIIASVACMAVSFFAFMALVSIAELSFAVPATAITYVLETILARYILKEHISWVRWTGAYLVACGVALLAQ